MITLIFGLLVLYQIKHYLADYMFQGEYMLGKFKPGWEVMLPLLTHVGVHAGMTLFIASWFVDFKLALLLAGLDSGIHFVMDRIKAGPKYLGRYKAMSGSEYMLARQIIDGGQYNEVYVDNAERLIKSNRYFWLALGLDQKVHHLTHYLIIYIIVMMRG